MKKVTNTLISAALLLVLLLSYSSCGDEEKKTASVSFATISQDVGEDEEEIFIPYDIENGPTADNATISFDFGGTATLDVDFEFLGWNDDGLYLTLIDDIDVETDETIVVTMTDSENVTVSSSPHTVTIEDDDVDTGTNLKIDLEWDSGDGTMGDVDMDLILWQYDAINDEYDFIDAAAGTTSFETLTLFAADPNGIYGLTYQYYDGTSNNLELIVKFTTTDGTIDGTLHQRTFTETYTLANVNPTLDVFIEQELQKAGTNYTNFTAINVPTTGSRSKSVILPPIKAKQNTESRRVSVKKGF